MSWSRHVSRSIFIALTLSAGVALSACSFTPVYSGTLANQPQLNLAYGKPTSRLEQIVYQELSLRLGSSAAPTDPIAMATVSTSTRNVTRSKTSNPNRTVEVSATITLVITPRDGISESHTFTRNATATYTTSNQVLSNNAAAAEASERATRAAAESLRLAILANLSRG